MAITVQDLIDELITYDPEMEVVFDQDKDGWFEIDDVTEELGVFNEIQVSINRVY